ncbi:MGMT family protein [Psychromicrobium lacuslunae]|uniref:Cysteine methyltransferase n=1 Tax=Psychromicrobium lacuslunae TaxID=1618207 RepID=A0A0D4BYX3_9MICC|nr:MGMT family protein [Psychromicrobium lacuslunae]AJT41523.1 cysteine methyltransferase [Psychromicrobium lacuslunae]
MRKEYLAAVLELTALIPPGSVLAYGDIAELLGDGGPRQVGSVMSHHGDGVAWWRVLRASGAPLEGHQERALEQYRKERTPLRGKTTGEDASWKVDMTRARWQPSEAEWQLVDAIAAKLEPRFRKVSEPDEITKL